VTKWDWEASRETTLEQLDSRGGRYPCLVGDIIGDWREEVILPSPDGRTLRLYATTFPTEHRIHTLMHDPQYRLGIAWQNVAYNKPAHPSFFLGDGMQPQSRPDIRLVGNDEAINLTHLPQP
jgi:rhamnogalacturonan endolyase